jgi:1-hydroxycarotenoid 3,4-desaturase
MTSKRVVVIGAGIGGLATALELAAKGCQVQVFERAPQVGGKMRAVTVDGAAMDAGPTVFTMRWVFDELFDAIGARLSDHLDLQALSVLARHAWHEGEGLDLFADVQRSADAIGDFAGTQASRGYRAFCARARDIYRTLEQPFLRGSRPNPLSLTARAGLRGLPGLMRISPRATMWQELGRYFTDPRLRQLFGRYATYCGSSPFAAPATLMLVAHVEQNGVWRVAGGMHVVAQALAGLAQARGATVRCHAGVDQILTRGGRVCGVRLADGEQVAADAVVFNGDVAALGAGLLGPAMTRAVPRTPTQRRSLSALTWNLRAHTHGFPLSRHNVFFSGDSAREFKDLFNHTRLPQDPTVYVCAQDRRGDDHDAASGPPGDAERLLLIVNAPAVGDTTPFSFTASELARCEEQSFRLMARCGLHITSGREQKVTTTPQTFEGLFPATGGALYGQASHGWMASFSRPGSRSRIPGLYLAGGSVHPGPGVPMAVLSGRQAAASVLKDLAPAGPSRRASTSLSPPTATPGGTSTR